MVEIRLLWIFIFDLLSTAAHFFATHPLELWSLSHNVH